MHQTEKTLYQSLDNPIVAVSFYGLLSVFCWALLLIVIRFDLCLLFCMVNSQIYYDGQETLRVKDEELNQLQRDLRARDLTIKELAERLSETADAAESAAKAVHFVDKERQVALTEVEHLKKELQRASEQVCSTALPVQHRGRESPF